MPLFNCICLILCILILSTRLLIELQDLLDEKLHEEMSVTSEYGEKVLTIKRETEEKRKELQKAEEKDFLEAELEFSEMKKALKSKWKTSS